MCRNAINQSLNSPRAVVSWKPALHHGIATWQALTDVILM